jgi:threonine dehydrogenase-like Zn-dependent dehydrogenase
MMSGRLEDVPDASPGQDEATVRVLQVGVDGTDRELIEGKYGQAPAGEGYLILGHESLGRIIEAPKDGRLTPGDLVVATVRRPDPEPCLNCAAGESDMCINDGYTERGIKGAHGFLAEVYFESPRYLVRLPDEFEPFGVLLEPLSVVEKAIEQIGRIQSRLAWKPTRAMVLGAGTIGTLAALLLRLDGLEVYVYSRGQGSQGRAIAEEAGGSFLSSDEWKLDHDLQRHIGCIDMVIEATGYSPFALQAVDTIGPNGVVCLTGVSAGSRKVHIDSSHLNLEMVLMNKLIFGTVNSNRRHFESGVEHMRAIELRWPGLLKRLITRHIPLERFRGDDIEEPGDLKVVVDLDQTNGRLVEGQP